MELPVQQAEGLRDYFLMTLENEHKATMAVIEHVPEDKLDYKPHDGLMAFGDLAFHIYTTGAWFADISATGKADFEAAGKAPDTPTGKAALLEACNQMNQQLREKVAAAPGEILAQGVEFGNFGTFPAVTFTDWHQRHLIHHRGQLTTYLRMMGAKVPATYGDSIDYPMTM